MSQIYDMYRMVKTVQKEIRRLDKLEPMSIPDDEFMVWHAPAANVMKRYSRHRPWLVPTEASHIIADYIEAGYLGGRKITVSPQDKGTNGLIVLAPGRKFIERTWFIFPTGLWQAWYEDNGKVFLAFMTTLVALLTGILIALGKLALLKAGK